MKEDEAQGCLFMFAVFISIIIGASILRSCSSLIRGSGQSAPSSVPVAPCDYSSGYDSLGRRCGGRGAEVIPGGRLGGTGVYVDPYGRLRIYGPCNDDYDGC